MIDAGGGTDVTDDTDMICHDLHIGSHHIVRYDMS